MTAKPTSGGHTVKRESGFTLIELLVVIAIIAILAAILFPVFAKARAKSWEAACMSNLKQIALGMIMYIQDHDGFYPNRRYWGDLGYGTNNANNVYWQYMIDPYIKGATVRSTALASSNLNIWQCPGAKLQSAALGGKDAWYGGAHSHYAINANLSRASGATVVNEAEVKYPSQTMLISEGLYWNGTRGEWWGWYLSSGYKLGSGYTRYDHDGRANIAFCDGHAKTGTEGQWTNGEWKMGP
jgi:prepilin-type N-terminal cleavage/methylation domain-containing protein/prepilin-type processing-associated H-X9-DG protein